MRVDVLNRRWRRLFAVVQLMLFAFSASTSLLPCANDMAASTARQPAAEHHASAPSHASHASHGASSQDATEPPGPSHHAPTHTTSGSCPWIVGCTGMAHVTFESSWRLVETTPVVTTPDGDVLRAVTAERDVESPPPRA